MNLGFHGREEICSLGTPILPSAPLPLPPPPMVEGVGFVWGQGAGMFYGESGFSLSSPFRSQREGGRGRGGMEVPPLRNPTITHTPGAAPGPGQGESKCVAVDLFSLFLFVLYGDAFLVFYTMRKQSPRDS